MARITVNRSLLKLIIFSILTLGIYALYFYHAIARDMNEMCRGDGKKTAGLIKIFLLSIITLGIYVFVWYYSIANRIKANAKRQYGLDLPISGGKVLMWYIPGSLLFGIGPFVALHIIIKNTNILAAFNNSGDKYKTTNNSMPKAAPKAAPAPIADNDDDIVTLTTQNGEEVDFIEIAGIAHKGNFYAILQPVELLDGMDDDEALVFKVSRGPDGEDKFEIELDDNIIDAVFKEYDRLLAEANK